MTFLSHFLPICRHLSSNTIHVLLHAIVGKSYVFIIVKFSCTVHDAEYRERYDFLESQLPESIQPHTVYPPALAYRSEMSRAEKNVLKGKKSNFRKSMEPFELIFSDDEYKLYYVNKERNIKLPVIRQSQLDELWSNLHSGLHNGRAKMEQIIASTIWMPSARKWLVQKLVDCVYCVKTKPNRIEVPQIAIIAQYYGERYEIDLFEMPLDPITNMRYVVNLVDCYSKYGMNEAIKTKVCFILFSHASTRH